MEYLFIYALQVVEIFKKLSILFLILGLVFTYALVAVKTIANDDFAEITNFKNYKAGIIMLIISFAFFLVPTKQTILLAAGTYYEKQLVQTEKVQKISNIIDLQLDKLINYLKEEVTNEKHR